MTAKEFKKEDGIEASSFDNEMRKWSYTEYQLLGFAERYHQAKIKEIAGFLKVAKCPNCDGSGAIPHEARTPEGSYVDWEQCQWCDERQKLIKQ